MVERIQEILKQKGIKPAVIEKELGWGNGSISKFKTSSPSINKLQQLADKLDVTVAYLIGEDDERNILNNDEKELILLYRSLSSESKKLLRERAITLKEQSETKIRKPSDQDNRTIFYTHKYIEIKEKEILNEMVSKIIDEYLDKIKFIPK